MRQSLFMKTLLLLIVAFCFTSLTVIAQDEEDFHRLARRSIDAYEAQVKKQQAGYDSATWHGAAYFGTSSRGRVLPNGFFNYKKGKLNVKGDLVMDLSDISTNRIEDGNYSSGTVQHTSTNILNKYEHEDLKLRFDYHLNKQNTLSLDMFQKYRSDRVGETATRLSTNTREDKQAEVYEDQQRKKKDFNCGTLLEHLYKFNGGGSLSSRIYFKYDNTPTDIESETWGKELVLTTKYDHQKYISGDAKGQVIYLSPVWNGFNFGVREKVGLMNMRIEDTMTDFEYDVTQTLSSFMMNYVLGPVTFNVQGGYETYYHDINTVDEQIAKEANRTYRDWIYHFSVKWKANSRNTFTANYHHTINRPTYTQLYPFVHVGSNIGSRVKGNASLQPSVVTEIQGRHSYKVEHLTLNTILTYQKKDDDITSVVTFDETEQMSVKTWVNDATYNTIKGALEGEMNFGPFSMTMGVHAKKLWYEGINVKMDKSWSYSFKARPQIKLPNDWMLATVILFNGREEHLHWYNKEYTYLALRAQKQLGNWAVYGFVQDLVSEKRVKSTYSNGNSILTTNDYNTRAMVLGCSYRF